MTKIFRLSIIIIVCLVIGNIQNLYADEKNYKIVKLVNEKVITNYDLEQRIKIYSSLNNVMINKENLDVVANKILNTMIDEILQLEQIKKYNIFIEDSEINDYINRVYLSESNDIKDFKLNFKNNNLDINILKESIRIMIGWNSLTNRLYYRTSEIDENELKKIMQNNLDMTKEQAENYLLQSQIGLRAKKLLRDIRAEATIENR